MVLAVGLFVNAVTFAQSSSQSPNQQSAIMPAPSSRGLISATTNGSIPGYVTSVRGRQGVLAETIDGSTVASQSSDEKFNPASAVKLATSLVALRNLGPNYRFVTSFWIKGEVDPTTGTLYGDLMVSGSDPSLHYEHAIMLAQELNRLGIETVSGNLIVTPGFTMNFDWSAKSAGDQFINAMDSARRSASATQAWIDDRFMAGDGKAIQRPPTVAVLGGAVVGVVPVGATPLLVRKSSKLVDVLKVMLCYSNNFMAERIGSMLGGAEGVSANLATLLKVDPLELSLASTSGLGTNRVSPRAMMKILRALSEELARNKLTLSDVLPVAGIDPGTLKERYTSDVLRGSVIAKTGTLIRTDGGASSLVGQTQTKSGRVVLFVIMNQQGNVNRFRENQDDIVNQIQNAFGGPAPFSYRPVALAMRLSDSDYEAARNRGEYEPRNQDQ